MAPTILNPAPVTVAWEIVIAAVPLFDRVRVWGLLDPADTLPKFRLVALAASVPEEAPFEFEFVFEFPLGVPAPVKPTQPESDKTANVARTKAKTPSGARRLEDCWCVEWDRRVWCAFITGLD